MHAMIMRKPATTEGVPIWAAGKIVGEVRNGVFTKRVRGSVHMLRRPPGWALDVQSLDEAEAAGVQTVCIIDTETGKRYRATVAVLRSDRAFGLDRGFGRQIALPLDYWRVDDPGGPKQLTLW